jgi:hypothetical protein
MQLQVLLRTFLDTNALSYIRFEVFTAVNMKNVVFWDVPMCRFCVNRRFARIFRMEISASEEPA